MEKKKYMKKYLKYLIPVVMFGLSLFTGSAEVFSEDIDIDDQCGEVGDTVIFTVSIYNAPNDVMAFGFDVNFDSIVLEYNKSYTIGDLTQDFDFFDYDIKRLSKIEGVEDIHASGTVCTYIKEECLKDYIFVGESNLFMGQDMNLGWHISRELNLRYLVDSSVKCPHWHLDEQKNVVIR